MRSTSAIVSDESDTGGVTAAASPEWQPAASMCSSIAPTTVISPSETQSTSSSMACVRNLSIRIGLPSEILTASSTYSRRRSSW